MLSAVVVAFSMYSRIPMPRIEWTEENMKYAVCFFPWIGAVIGGVEIGVWYLCGLLKMGEFFRTAALTVIPVLVTGGIHLDGFLDTVDARSSHQDRERKLEILKDSHIGAFALIGCAVYFLLSVAGWSEVDEAILPVAAVSFFLSRSYSGLAVVAFRQARKKGMLASFAEQAHKKRVKAVMIVYLALASVFLVWLSPLYGTAAAAAALAVFGYYRYFSYREFGGVTGDLAGYFLQLCELAMILVPAILERLVSIL
ncbi:adenosylcobinamide-GDP ribazoletransferase [Hominifimenecus sp. rT4P-3]|uniref:adenosylcobinamide-GDP ribazoletransferase n=1 Tax=Hominifimenecus sp. rT4P-3 TaxID=3242979 RepID=UPI003DA463DC